MRCKRMWPFLIMAGALLLGAITCKALFGSWAACHVMPSSSQGAPYATVGYVYEAPVTPLRPR